MYSSIGKHLLRTENFDGNVDFFFVGHLGKYENPRWHGAKDVDVSDYIKNQFNGSEEKALTHALRKMPNAKHVEVHQSNNCSQLMAAREKEQLTGPRCGAPQLTPGTRGAPTPQFNGLQALWVDYCFAKVKKSGQYDMVVRSRPDVAVFHPLPWNELATNQPNFVESQGAGGTSDWFFILPNTETMNTYWKIALRSLLESEEKGNFDYSEINVEKRITSTNSFYKRHHSFPIVIVRRADFACCGYIKPDSSYRKDCKQLVKDNYFMIEH